MLPKGHRFTNPPSFQKALAVRDPANTNAPGLEGNKNGPPGPGGNQKGPPGAALTTEELASLTSQTSLSETEVSSSSNPPPLPASSPAPPASTPALITTSTSSRPAPSAPGTPTTASALAASGTVAGTLTSTTSSVESLTTPAVSASSDEFSTSAKYSVSGSPSSTLSAALLPVQTTLRTTFTYTSSATTLQTGMVYYAQNSTAQSEYSAALPGQKAGAAVRTIGMFSSPFSHDHPVSEANDQVAGFAFILTLIFLLFRWHRAELPKALPCPVRRLPGTWGNSRWLSRYQIPDAMSDSLLIAEVGSSGSPAWDYRATFARPTLMEKARRSLRKSLTRICRFNPLGLNPVTPQSTGAITPSRRSFASFFHRFSATSTHHSDFCPSFLQDPPISVIDPQSPPPLPPPRPSAISGWSREFPQSDTDDSPRPRTMAPQVPLLALQRPWHHRSSQITMACEESKARSFKSVPGWVKFHYPHRSRSGRGGASGILEGASASSYFPWFVVGGEGTPALSLNDRFGG